MLHPQAAALLKLIEEKGLPPVHVLAPPEAREMYRQRRFFTQPEPPEVGAVQALQAPGRPARSRCAAIGRPAARPARCCPCSCTTTAAAG